MNRLTRRTLRLALSALCALSALTVIAPAQAAELSAEGSCTSPTGFSRPFMRWLDPAPYALAPGGAFEGNMTDWRLDGGAATVAGNETFYVNSTSDRRSLALPAGSSATSAATCVGVEHPVVRFFVRNTGSTLATLRVDVLGVDTLGAIRSIASTPIVGTRSWAPSPQVLLLSNVSGLLSNDGLTPIALRFTPAGGSWQIDDLYVDPFRRG